MTTSVISEKFESGDISSWLRQVEVCAIANEWNNGKKLKILPAFLGRKAAMHYFALNDDKKADCGELKKSLTSVLCPPMDWEKHYADFNSRFLRPNEDPSTYLLELKKLLTKADDSLTADARYALLCRQVMEDIPEQLRLKLLQSDPTPKLDTMINFIRRFCAVHRTTKPVLSLPTPTHALACSPQH